MIVLDLLRGVILSLINNMQLPGTTQCQICKQTDGWDRKNYGPVIFIDTLVCLKWKTFHQQAAHARGLSLFFLLYISS